MKNNMPSADDRMDIDMTTHSDGSTPLVNELPPHSRSDAGLQHQTVPHELAPFIEWLKEHQERIRAHGPPHLDVAALITALEELNDLVGMKEPKRVAVRQIKYFLRNRGQFDGHYRHTAIEGEPGTGKTTLGKTLVSIWHALGLFPQSSGAATVTTTAAAAAAAGFNAESASASSASTVAADSTIAPAAPNAGATKTLATHTTRTLLPTSTPSCTTAPSSPVVIVNPSMLFQNGHSGSGSGSVMNGGMNSSGRMQYPQSFSLTPMFHGNGYGIGGYSGNHGAHVGGGTPSHSGVGGGGVTVQSIRLENMEKTRQDVVSRLSNIMRTSNNMLSHMLELRNRMNMTAKTVRDTVRASVVGEPQSSPSSQCHHHSQQRQNSNNNDNDDGITNAQTDHNHHPHSLPHTGCVRGSVLRTRPQPPDQDVQRGRRSQRSRRRTTNNASTSPYRSSTTITTTQRHQEQQHTMTRSHCTHADVSSSPVLVSSCVYDELPLEDIDPIHKHSHSARHCTTLTSSKTPMAASISASFDVMSQELEWLMEQAKSMVNDIRMSHVLLDTTKNTNTPQPSTAVNQGFIPPPSFTVAPAAFGLPPSPMSTFQSHGLGPHHDPKRQVQQQQEQQQQQQQQRSAAPVTYAYTNDTTRIQDISRSLPHTAVTAASQPTTAKPSTPTAHTTTPSAAAATTATNPEASTPWAILSRPDFVSDYMGQTARQTRRALDKHRGKGIFIDEAHSLYQDEKDTFGKEASSEILRFMDASIEDTVIILATYPGALRETIFKADKGLRRRIQWFFKIEGYTPSELAEIFRRQARRYGGWSLDNRMDAKLLSFFTQHKKKFPHYAGDTFRLLYHCKLASSERHAFRSLLHPPNNTITPTTVRPGPNDASITDVHDPSPRHDDNDNDDDDKILTYEDLLLAFEEYCTTQSADDDHHAHASKDPPSYFL